MIESFAGRRVVVCAGTGGVGKTTVSAAIGIAAAASGRRTLVMTIDPARRLANALGLPDFGNVEHEIPREALAPYGVELTAPLWVMMPDVKRTFDELVERYARTEQERRSIMGNFIYKQFATRLAGSLDYAAVEKLYEVYTSGRYDLIVLDTPPSQSVGDFLTAPNRVISFLEQDTVQWLIKPYLFAGRLSVKLLDLGSAVISRSLRRLAGADTLRSIAEFLVGFHGMFEGFRERSQRVRALLASDEVAFALVGTARATDRAALLRFRATLAEAGLATRLLVLNRTRPVPYPERDDAVVHDRIASALPADSREVVLRALDEEAALAHEDIAARQELSAAVGDVPVIALPELPLDVHDLESLATLQRWFRGPAAHVDTASGAGR
jgi:anion-transporting  ArsA/GET3 family ATPase